MADETVGKKKLTVRREMKKSGSMSLNASTFTEKEEKKKKVEVEEEILIK